MGSSRMSSLLDTGTDTDDQTPVRPRHVPARLEFKESDQDKTLILPPPRNLNKVKDSLKKPNKTSGESVLKITKDDTVDDPNINVSQMTSLNKEEKQMSDDA